MAKKVSGEKLRKMMSGLFRKAFGRNLDDLLALRGSDLWALGLDGQARRFRDIFSNIEPSLLQAVQDKGFTLTDAGFQADAQNILPIGCKKVDVFLVNVAFLESGSPRLEPLIVHELAHFLEQIGEAPLGDAIDQKNADAILISLMPDVLDLHSREWALHLAIAARRLVQQKLTTHRTIRSFLDVAVPEIDRMSPVYAKLS
ncbi:MAG: hypothetical protein E5Y34_21980 [Mesorhizobium sp.]|uniref:hypothetical protein n=1 Tax=Mesorhizobium sp. TaxID=1871066 RepID=UPI0011FFFEBA|nr:hypothetical protein [Mesorhizobium sp.]TIM96823.1 MAG: hypothetical protein E5Y34_21980 [Mesorhizobium sp.]